MAAKMPKKMKSVCMYCKRVIREGSTGPDGMASHGICDSCLEEHHPEDLTEQMEESQNVDTSTA